MGVLGFWGRLFDPTPPTEPVDVAGRDFRFDPVSGRLETITGTVQFGNTFDDWGNRFLCSQSQPLLHVVLPERYLLRNPHLPVPYALKDLAPGPVPIFRTSPIERWRMIRSSRRIAQNNRSASAPGASHHVVDAAAGVTVYRGGAYPPEYYGNIFVGGPQNNLIHRRSITPDGASFQSHRADAGTEFVRSSDIWFRPVNFVNAPDGTLYVLDMAREVLETIHIPLDVVQFLDLTSGRERGRIYRLAPPKFRYPGPSRLGNATTDQLIELLASPHGWTRDTAHRLIFERQDKSAVGPLRRVLLENEVPQARLHALWSLHGLDALQDDDLVRALDDTHPSIREHAMRLAEPRLDSDPRLLAKVLSFVDDPNPRIRVQTAFSLGESTESRVVDALARLARNSSSDRWMRTAILSSSGEIADVLLAKLLDDAQFAADSGGQTFLSELATVVGARNRRPEVHRVLETLATHESMLANTAFQPRLLLVLGKGLKRTGARLAPANSMPSAAARLLRQSLEAARTIAGDEDTAVERRQEAVQLLGCARFAESRETLSDLIDVRQPEGVQIEAVQAIAGYSNPAVGKLLLQGLPEYAPAVRKQAVGALLERTERTVLFLEAVLDGRASVAQIDASQRSMLLKRKDGRIQSLAKKLFGDDASTDRSEIVAAYHAALELDGDASRGETVFRRECMSCHKIGDLGHSVGPDLTSISAREAGALLVHVLDPNRYVLPNYESYVAVTDDGRLVTGLIAAQTATSITLRREEGQSQTLLRVNIDTLQGTGASLMPDGFEKKISKQEMADLIAMLLSNHKPSEPRPLDIGTLPGMIEPE